MSRGQQRKGARVHNSEVLSTEDLGSGVDDRVRVASCPHGAWNGGESVRVGSPMLIRQLTAGEDLQVQAA